MPTELLVFILSIARMSGVVEMGNYADDEGDQGAAVLGFEEAVASEVRHVVGVLVSGEVALLLEGKRELEKAVDICVLLGIAAKTLPEH